MSIKIRKDNNSNKLIILTDQNEKIPSINLQISNTQIPMFGINWIGEIENSKKTISAITSMVDPLGVKDDSIITGKLFFSTSGDDGILKKRLEIDKDGRVIVFGQLWVTTYLPSGSPLIVQSHYDENSDGCRLVLRRSRNNYLDPKSVVENDNIFRLTFSAHDGFQYKDVAYISSSISGKVSKNIIPSKIIFKTTDNFGKINSVLELFDNKSIKCNGPLCVMTYDSFEDIKQSINQPVEGMIIFNKETKEFLGFNGDTWKNLTF
jgi:hypothetical protein